MCIVFRSYTTMAKTHHELSRTKFWKLLLVTYRLFADTDCCTLCSHSKMTTPYNLWKQKIVRKESYVKSLTCFTHIITSSMLFTSFVALSCVLSWRIPKKKKNHRWYSQFLIFKETSNWNLQVKKIDGLKPIYEPHSCSLNICQGIIML